MSARCAICGGESIDGACVSCGSASVVPDLMSALEASITRARSERDMVAREVTIDGEPKTLQYEREFGMRCPLCGHPMPQVGLGPVWGACIRGHGGPDTFTSSPRSGESAPPTTMPGSTAPASGPRAGGASPTWMDLEPAACADCGATPGHKPGEPCPHERRARVKADVDAFLDDAYGPTTPQPRGQVDPDTRTVDPGLSERSCPTMPNPTSVLAFDTDPEIAIREVISRLCVLVGGPLTEALAALSPPTPCPHGKPRIVCPTCGPSEHYSARVAIANATSYLDAALDAFDAAYPPPPEPDEPF